ncbi:MAG: hypothetical protein V2A66_06485 [Pseudomonadota bacterium]
MKHKGKHLPACRAGRRCTDGRERGATAKKGTVGEWMTALDLIEKSWPEKPGPGVREAISKIRRALERPLPTEAAGASIADLHKPLSAARPSAEKSGPGYLDALDLARHVLMAHDLLFLSRQVTYQISASVELPRIWADADQVSFVLSQLTEHAARRSARGSRISISFKKYSLRDGPGIEIGFSITDKHLGDIERQGFLAELFEDRPDRISGVSLSESRQIAVRQLGLLWVDFIKPQRPVYHLALPSSERAALAERASQQTFKYDISINNFADMRKRFGIRKSHSLLTQIEHYVRSLVRYPIDMVMSLSDRGIITTIYETQRGTAQSVASRISERLGSERFRIGRRPVDVAFSYRLSPLSSSPSARGKEAGERGN